MNQKVSAGSIIRTGSPSARAPHTRHGVSNETILSKMIRDNSPYGRTHSGQPYLGGFTYLHEVSDIISNNIEDAINLNQLQPEIEICIQIMTTLILSPKDALNTDLTHQVQPNILPSEMTSEMLDILRDYSENGYKIKPLLAEKLRKALFQEGADVTVIIPENSLDDLINGRSGKKITTESFKDKSALKDIGKPLGFMANPARAGQPAASMTLESILGNLEETNQPPLRLDALQVGDFAKVPGFAVPELYDNPNMLKLADITASAKAVRRKTILENLGNSTFSGADSLYHDGNLNPEDIVIIPRQEEASRETVGEPLIKSAPTEATIPLHAPGQPDKPIGFLFLLDEYGSLITRATRTDYFRTIQNGVFNNRTALSGMLQNAAGQMDNEDNWANWQLAQQASMAFRDMAIRDIESRLLAGSAGNVVVSRQQLAYDLMLERAFSGKQTRIVYAPADMVVYWAYRYNENGTGRSLLEDNKILSAIRALTLFMNVETMIRNSVDHRTLNITLDEDDPNKSRTKEMILHEYARHKANAMPWATSNPRRMVEMAQQSGLAINVEGGDNYPGTKVAIESRDIMQREVNLDLDEDLRKRQTMGFGIAPEIVDLSTQIEFSSKMATSNELSRNRAILLQEITNGFIRQLLIKICISHKGLMDKLRAIVGKHLDKIKLPKEKLAELDADYFVRVFFSIYSVKLPKPNNGLANRMEELQEYCDAIDKMLENILPDDMLSAEALGTSSEEWVRVVKASVKSTMVLRFCRENNILPEFTDLFDNNTEEDPGTVLVNESLDNTSRLSKIIQAVGLKLYSSALISENQWTTLKERLDAQRVEGAEAPEGGGGSGWDSGGEDDSGEEEGGGEDFGFDDDLNLDEGGGGETGGETSSESEEKDKKEDDL